MFKIFNLEGLFLSKAKKIISMLLVLAMVLTVAPVSLTAFAADGTYTEPKVSSVQFTVDTTATTEVIRVAAAAGSFSLGTAIVPATPAGIPQNSGAFASVAYAGETPAAPKVVFKITGASLSETPSITTTLTSCQFSDVQSSTSGNVTTYTWNITGGVASAGTDVVFTIDYKVNGASYQAHAYSHVENILVMGGFLTYKKNTQSSNTARHSVVTQLQSINMYSGMCQDTTVSNRKVGYINYASTGPDEGTNLYGMGNSDDLSTAAAAYASAAPNDSITGEEQGVLIKSRSESTGTQRNMCYNNDTNKSENTVYIDKRKHKSLSDLKLKLIMQNGEESDIGTIYAETATVYVGHKTFGDEDGGFTSDSAASAIMTINGTGSGNAITGSNVYGSVTLPFSGTGPTTVSDSEQQYSMIINIYSNNSDRTNRAAGGINLDFYVHDTSDLWGMYNGALKGTGSYTCVTSAYAGSVLTFNKGVNPQASMYTAGWAAYEAAMNNAGKILVKPDAKQSEIDAAALELYNAYNGLSDVKGPQDVTIKHVAKLADGSTLELGQQNASNTPVLAGVPVGSTIVGYPATFTGYSIIDNSPQTLVFKGNETGNIEMTFYYSPLTYNLNVYTNTDANGDGNIDVITTKPAYGSTVKLSELAYGTKANYKFEGFYTDLALTQKASDFVMPNATVTLYVKWVPDDIDINVVMMVGDAELGTKTYSVTPVEGETVEFNKPSTADQPYAEGYLFAGYFEDAACTVEASWPRSYELGSPDDTLYAKMVDVNGKIIFVSNGGSAVEDIHFTPNTAIAEPAAPTRAGYTFTGWTKEDGSAITWPVTLPDATGFIAYATWEAADVTISFNIGGKVTKYDTEAIAPIVGKADSLIDPEFYPNEPLKFGYVFDGWSLNGVRYNFNGKNKYPTENIELKALWRSVDTSAFADIVAYEKLSGSYVETDKASVGDTVTFRMTTQTNFAVGSSVFVFMYDSNFFELVNEGTSAFAVNRDNEYIDGINAKINGVTDDSALPWPDMARTETKADGSSAYYKAMMITIDPTITADDYYCAPLNDGKWLVEFKLKVKDDATGSGKVYMSNDWTRTEDNIMGTQFYGWSKSVNDSVADTYNNKVTPNLDAAYAIITIDEVIPADTTVTLNANGGAWADGSTEKTYTGRTETEIADYVRPEYAGYHLPDADAWKLADGDAFWAEGYYEKEAQSGSVYLAQWIPNDYTINYYVDGAVYATETATYGQLLPNTVTAPSKVGYEIKGWATTEGGEAIDFATFTCPIDGADLYAIWGPRDDTAYTITVKYVILTTGNTTEKVVDMTGTTDSIVKIVETVPSPAEEGVTYITLADLPVVTNYVYDPSNNTLPIEATIAADGSTNLDVWYVGKSVTFTYDANGGTFADGSSTKAEVKTYLSLAEGPGEEPTRPGYDFAGWQGVTFGTTRMNADGTKKANWTVKKYPATFNVNGGAWADGTTEDKVTEFEFGKTVTAPATPAKEGYIFKGWATSATATEAESLGTMDNTDGKTYYAVYALAEYTVTYKLDGAQLYVDTYHMGDAVTLRAAETKTGYSFSGWMLNGAAATDFTMPAEDIVLEATFTANSYEVVFDANGGYFGADTQATTNSVLTKYEATIVAPEQPTRNGYEFIGWAAAPDSTDKITNFGTLNTTETVTYYAIWNATVADYTINIYYMDVNGAYPETAEKTETLSGLVGTTSPEYDPAGNLKPGFTFDAANSVLSGVIDADNPLVLTVKYSRNQYALSTNVDGVKTEIGMIYYEADVTAPEAPEKVGYNFTGWSGMPADGKMPNNDVELTATWEAKDFTATWNVDGVTSTTTVAYGQAIMAPADPTKTGYSFAGWDGYSAGMTMPAEDVTFTATWTKNSYTITYRTYNGVYTTETVPYDDVIVLPAEPTRTGYTFTGWQGYTEGMTMPAANQVFVAQWSINNYTVTWDVDGATTVETYAYGAEIAKMADPAKDGYTFAGWAGYTDGMTMPAANQTFTAEWTVIEYTVTWDVDGATTEETYAYGATIVKPADPAKEGYTFAGWSPAVPATQGVGDATYTATWTVNNYTVTWNVDGVEETETYAYGAAIAEKAAPSKVGHTFTGWEGYAAGMTMPAANKTFTATWDVNNYTVTWVVDGETVKTETVAYGSALNAPADPEKAGYTFAGWDPEVPATQGAADVTYTATWTVNEYTVTWDVDGATTEETYAYGAAIVAPADPAKEGYTFAGWTPEVPATQGIGDATYTAQWTINEYTITWVIDGATTVETYDYNEAITVKADPEKAYYTFEGWTWTNEDGEAIEAFTAMPAYNVTITAEFARVPVTLVLNSTAVVEKVEEPTDTFTGYIYGVESKLKKDQLIAEYLGVEGDGTLLVTPFKFGICGTGTKVELYDNVEEMVIETYYIVIFGDINGDSKVDSVDLGMVEDEALGLTYWSAEDDPDFEPWKVKAADISGSIAGSDKVGDGLVSAGDISEIRNIVLKISEVDQTTGIVTIK